MTLTLRDRIQARYGTIADTETLKQAYRAAAEELADAIPAEQLCLAEPVGTLELCRHPGQPLHRLKLAVVRQVRAEVDGCISAELRCNRAPLAHLAAEVAISAARVRARETQEVSQTLGLDRVALDYIPDVVERLQARFTASPYGQAVADISSHITDTIADIKGACFIRAAQLGAASAREYADHAVECLRELKERYCHQWIFKLEAERGMRCLGAASLIRDLTEATIRHEAEWAYRATELFYRPEAAP